MAKLKTKPTTTLAAKEREDLKKQSPFRSIGNGDGIFSKKARNQVCRHLSVKNYTIKNILYYLITVLLKNKLQKCYTFDSLYM